MMWILIIMLSTFDINGGLATTSAEFSSMEQCEAAAVKIKQEFDTVWNSIPKKDRTQ